MIEHFNQLSPAEAERLACLAEECGEVIQAIGKVLRHGYEDYSPFDETQTTNRQNLEREIGDISAVIDTMRFANDVSDIRIHLAANEKLAKLPRWTHHQPNSEGMPTPQSKMTGVNTDLLKALKYVRRFLNPEDHDVSYVDDVIDKAEGRGLYAATPEGQP